MPDTLIVKTSDGQLFKVRDAGPDYPQAWIGSAVKMVRGAFVAKAKARDILVRKAGSRVVAAAI